MSERPGSDAVRDPFYQQIVIALAGPLDHDVFERCMGDLLRKDFPGLVPVPGGGDFGVDGLISDAAGGEPFPLICTTQEDVIGNLTGSLDSYLRRGLPSRKVALAASQFLTPPRRMNLFDRAREKGFVLMQVFDRPALADRLYESSRWCRELLGLSGVPSILSVVPATRRPLIEIEPVGREADIAWLRAIRGDSVLSGEPGSGKTFLVYHLMRQGWPGLFLAPGPVDLSALALALQEKKPEIVVVDDAFADPDRLVDLLRLRREKEMRFQILATTWKGGESEVLDALGGLPPDRVRRLELLTRDEILQVFRSVGVAEDNDDLMRHLVDQAANKPGLAVTIATLWLQGSWQIVVEGTALSSTLTIFFQRYLGREATDVLAAFSLGGARGMPQEAVREFLKLSRPEFRHLLAGLLAGGVLFEAGEATLMVRPPQLRAPLLKAVFFPDDGGGLPYRDLLDRAPSRAKSVLALIETKARGGRVPDEDLRSLVQETGAVEVWGALPWLSEDHARWVQESYKGDVLDVVSGALDKLPQEAIRRVLERAEELERAGDRADRSMDFLLSWARELLTGPSRELQRRRELARAAARFLRSGGMPSIGAQGLLGALSPVRRTSSTDPGIGRTVKMWSGLLPLNGLQEIEGIWQEFHGDLREIDRSTWLHLTRMLEDWIEPRHALYSAEVSPGIVQVMNRFATRVLQDLLPLAAGSPGLASAFRRLAKRLNLELAVAEDPLFSAFFPTHPSGIDEWQEQRARGERFAQELAEKWASRPPAEVARQIVFYDQEAQRIGEGGWSENLLRLCSALATKVDDPGKWLEAFVNETIPERLAAPFLERLVEDQSEDWQGQLERFLGNHVLAWTATAIVVGLQEPPEALLEAALRQASRFPRLVEGMCLRAEVPLPTLRRLLRSTDPGVLSAALIGEWASDPEGSVREEIRTEWREAFLNWREDPSPVNTEYWLAEILDREPDLAFGWLNARLKAEDLPINVFGESVSHAARALDREQRKKILAAAPGPSALLFALIPLLVQRDLELYRELLQRQDLMGYHLRPLQGPIDESWVALATAALEAGKEAREIAEAAFPWFQVLSIPGLEQWRQWDQAWEKLECHPRYDLREIAKHGREWAQKEIRRAESIERHWALYGAIREGPE